MFGERPHRPPPQTTLRATADDLAKLTSPPRKNGPLAPRQLVKKVPLVRPTSINSNTPRHDPCDDLCRGDVRGVPGTTNVAHALTGDELELKITRDCATQDPDSLNALDVCDGDFSVPRWLDAMDLLLHECIGQTVAASDPSLESGNPSEDAVEEHIKVMVAEYRETKQLRGVLVEIENILVGQNNFDNYMKYLVMVQFDRRKRA